MKRKVLLLVVLVLLVVPLSFALDLENMYFIELGYKDGVLGFSDIRLVTGYATISSDPNLPYKVEVLSGSEDAISVGYFRVPNTGYVPLALDVGESFSRDTDYLRFSISVPYDKGGSVVTIEEKGKEVLDIDVSGFAAYCGDGLCQSDEDNKVCAEDCLPLDGFKEQLSPREFNLIPYLIILGVVGIILVGIFSVKGFSRLNKTAKKHDVHEPHNFINKVVNYINELKKQGYNDDKITANLKSLGWQENQIKEGFSRYNLLGEYHDMKSKNKTDASIKKSLSKTYDPNHVEGGLKHYSVLLGKGASDKKQRAHLNEIAKEHGVTGLDKIKDYIKQCYSHGYTKDIIISVLKENKWSQETIDRAFGELRT
ncbi:MAG: hypothetical protein U9O94_01745 [Nanoarchaeota archaeon]|nr:hypothetical protein [Nanoarchaeota archaeon]